MIGNEGSNRSVHSTGEYIAIGKLNLFIVNQRNQPNDLTVFIPEKMFPIQSSDSELRKRPSAALAASFNPSLQPTAGRPDASLEFMKPVPFQSMLALASDG